MKILIAMTLGTLLLTGCSDGSDNNRVVRPPEGPPTEPPVEPPMTMTSFAGFTRALFSRSENDAPDDINQLEFNQDAADDDFSDLLQ
jgi:PBP1b-binding outer membrane lipoprotein LpoB